MKEKRVSDSYAEQVHVIMPQHLNSSNMLFGGQLALWIDELAGVVAKRHSESPVTTAAIDNLRFRRPVTQSEMLVMRGKITYVGSTSMEIRVDSYAEGLTGERKLVNTAFIINVALDENNRPKPVPRLIRENEFEEREYQAGAKRKELRKQLNKELYDLNF